MGLLALLAIVQIGSVAPTSEQTLEAPPRTVTERREELAREIQAVRAGATELEAGERSQRLSQLEALDRVLSALAEAGAQAAELETKAKAAPTVPVLEERIATGPPYSLTTLDLGIDAVEAQHRRTQELAAALAAAESALESVKAELEKTDKARRRIRDEIEANPAGAAASRLRQQLRERELAARVIRAEIELRQAERSNARAALDQARRGLAWRESAVETLWKSSAPSADEITEKIATIDKRRFDLERSLATAKLDQESAERRWKGAVRRLEAVVEPSADLKAELAARRSELTRAERAATFAEAQRARLAGVAEIWERRAAVASGSASQEEEDGWLLDARQTIEAVERESRLARARLIELDQEREAVLVERSTADAATARWLDSRSNSLDSLIELYRSEIESLAESGRLAGRLAATVDRDRIHLDLGERWTALRSGAREVWATEITSSDDRSITVGKILTALLVFVVGWLAARGASGLLGRRVFPRLRLDEGAANAFESLTFYFLIVIVFLMTLRTVGIPLTAFAVVGGALAIGIGFGSQNVVSNFISGLILLAERPIKRGDLVEVDGTYGNVEHIGLRSTRIRSGDNIHIIVPNAAFLEGKVTNWTHNDPNVRVWISVGVVYGAPTREVDRLIRKALQEHPKVKERPQPVVLFKNFGDNALEFEVAFWVHMRNMMERLSIESDLRFHIDDLFREAGIVIAFPQRDVHLDTLRPLDVRVVAPDTEPEG